VISIESETAKLLDTTELTKAFAFLKTWEKHLLARNIANAYRPVSYIRCVDGVEKLL